VAAKIKTHLLWLPLLVILLAACAKTTYYSNIENINPTTGDERYKIFLQPRFMDYGLENASLRRFILTVMNHSDKDLRVVWKDTHFILNGDDKSGFVFSDTNPKFRHVPKTPSVVSPGRRLREDLFPAGYASYRIAWDYRTLPKGELGVLVSMQIEGETITELLTLLHDTNIKK